MDEGGLIGIDSKMGPIHSPLVPTNRQPPSHKAPKPPATNELQLGIENRLASFGTIGSEMNSPWLCSKDPPKESPPWDRDNFEVALNVLMDKEAKVETEMSSHSISSKTSPAKKCNRTSIDELSVDGPGPTNVNSLLA
jgi:hypothetical protein